MELNDQTDAPDPSFPTKQPPKSTEDEATSVPEPVYTVLRRGVTFNPAGNRTRFLDHPSRNLVTIPTAPNVAIIFNITLLENKFYFVPD
jgi:hypothetical protein